MAVKKVAKEADAEVNWSEYFASIVSVCPWSKAYWAKQKIDICEWTGELKELGTYVARVYKFANASDYKLNKLMKQFNKEREDEEKERAEKLRERKGVTVKWSVRRERGRERYRW